MDYKIVIDAGHGGSDSGAIGNGIIEKDLNLTISQLMYQRFQDLGVPVTLIRNSDETISPTDRTKRILNAYGGGSNVIVISNHINADGGDGTEVIYALRNNANLSNLIATEIQREGQNIRNVYQRRLPSDTSKDYYFIHRDTSKTQPVIVEYGFLDSPLDDVGQLKNSYPKYVDAVVRAVMEYMGKTPPLGGGVGSGTYTVKSGDSLWSIAKIFHTTVDEIKRLNNLTSNTLRIGQVLKMPVVTSVPGEETHFYIIKSGDSLYKIASQFHMTVAALMKLNNLTSSNLYIGQQLRVPIMWEIPDNGGNNGGDTGTPSTYTVKSGDSLYKIANQFNTTVNELVRLNQLTSNVLNIGQVLKVLGSSSTTPGVPSIEKPTEEYIIYVVKPGDSLYKIANQFNTTVDHLMNINNLSTNLLSVGQSIKVPSSESSNLEKTYVIKVGDSLYRIANQFNTNVDALRRRNSLKNDNLSIGQVLIIP